MKIRKLPVLVAILAIMGVTTGARNPSSSGSGEKAENQLSTHRQYSQVQLEGSDTQQSSSYKTSPRVVSLASSSSGGNAYGGSSELTSGTRGSAYDTSKGFVGQNTFSSNVGASSVEYGGAAEGSFNPGFPASTSVGGGYPSQSPPQQGHPPVDSHQSQGQPAYTYYYQHYPTGAVGGNYGGEAHEEGHGGGGGFGDLGGGLGGGGGALAAVGGLKGLGILAAIAKGVLAIKPFLILGLLLLIALPVLLLFLPIPIITVTGNTRVTPSDPSGRRGRSDSTVSYLVNLSERVLTADECLERFLCKLPKAPEPYRKKAKSLWEQYGSGFVKNQRVSRGVKAYFDTSSEKNRNFKCDQRFSCTNKFI